MTPCFSAIRGLREIWAGRTRRAPYEPRPDQFERMVFDLLGLGLEQALQYLGQNTPTFEEFEAWAIATAGPSEAEAIARYHAALDGQRPLRRSKRGSMRSRLRRRCSTKAT